MCGTTFLRVFLCGFVFQVKAIERTTNHDVKAVEYMLKQRFEQHPLLTHRNAVVSRPKPTKFGLGYFLILSSQPPPPPLLR